MSLRPILYVSTLLTLVIFDSAQQKYYLDTFDLAPSDIGLLELFIAHLARWGCWLLIIMPATFLYRKKIVVSNHFKQHFSAAHVAASVVLALIGIIAISLLALFETGRSAEWPLFSNYFSFYFFQKGLTFSVANIMVVLIIHDRANRNLLLEQTAQIHLYEKRIDQIQQSNSSEGHLQVKTGSKISIIPIEEIIWIQSYDYCVKVHVKDRSFTIRKSLKSLEKELNAFGFLRIHRCALINLSYVSQINTSNQKVSLQDHVDVPASKSGIRALRNELSNQIN